MKLQQKLLELKRSGKGILAANFYNFETLKGVLVAANETGLPVILQLSKSSIEYMGLKTAVSLARGGLDEFQVEGWLHLDHGDSFELVEKCLKAGFDSVMIDASELEFEKNVRITSEVVKLARKYGSNVEAELGYIAKLGQEQIERGFTRPEEAAKFVELTGVDALAVAIGSAHGFYKEVPNLRIDILKQIQEVTSATLVLHGSSGIPHWMLKEAISNGITKINLATEIKDAFMRNLKYQLAATNEIDLRKLFPPAIESVTNLVKNKLLMLNAERNLAK